MDTSYRNKSPWLKATFLVTLLIGIIGVLLIYISFLLKSQSYPEYAVGLIHDLGMVLSPIGFIGLIYEIMLREEYERRINNVLVQSNYKVDFVFVEDKRRILEETILKAKKEILLLGISPIKDFEAIAADVLTKHFKRLKRVKILALKPNSSYVNIREKQIGKGQPDIKGEIEWSRRTWLNILNEDKELLAKAQYAEYDLPPAHFMCIVDKKKLFLSWYPFGTTSGSFFSIYIDDINKSPLTERVLDSCLTEFEFVESDSNTKAFKNGAS